MKKIYFISFDQYNSNVDPFNPLKDIWNIVLPYVIGYYDISILTSSSLNDRKVKEYQTKLLFRE